jgi:hypothetical protein
MALKITGAIVVQRPEHGNRRPRCCMQPQKKNRNVDIALVTGCPFDGKTPNLIMGGVGLGRCDDHLRCHDQRNG